MRLSGLRPLITRSSFLREQVRGRRLRRIHHDWSGLLSSEQTRWDAARAGATGRKALIATSLGSSGWGAAAAMDAALGIGLTLREAQVRYLLCDGLLPACMECDASWYRDEARFAREGPDRRHCAACFEPADAAFRSTGLPVDLYSELLTAGDHAHAEAIALGTPFDDIPSLVEDGIALGEHAMAGALRFYARATLADPHSEAVLRRYLRAALLTASATRALIRREGIEVVVAHHGIYAPQGIVAETARAEGVRVVTWHPAYRRQTFIFSHGDTYHHTLMDEPVEAWESLPWGQAMEQEIMGYLASRAQGTSDWISFVHRPQGEIDAIASELGIDFSRPTVGLLTNVMWDAQLHYPANAFGNMLDWVVRTVAYFAQRPELQLVIRVHPAEVRGTLKSRQRLVDELRKSFGPLPSNVFLIPPESRASTYAVLARCNAALVFGTKMGVELTSVGIPTIVAGEAWIRNKGLTRDAASAEDYINLLDELPFASRMGEPQQARARKYAYHFFFRRMIPSLIFEPHSGYPPFTVGATSLGDLAPGGDPGLQVICDGVIDGTPFIFPYEERGVGPRGGT